MSIKNTLKKGKYFFNSLMWGLKSADSVMLEQKSQGLDPDVHVEKHLIQESVFNDLLQEQETEKVKEFRDSMYRVFKEADTLNVSVDLHNWDREDSDGFNENAYMTAKVSKKDKSFFEKRPLIEEDETAKVMLIQDQVVYDLSSEERNREMNGEKVRPQRLISIKYDGFSPRFFLDDYIKRLILKEKEGKYIIDLYFNDSQRHFNHLDAMFLKNIFEKFNKPEYKFDSLDFSTISFITSKANGVEDLKEYKLEKPRFINITHFNGNYIVHMEVMPVILGNDVTEKYKTEELTKKYEECAPKSDVIDFEVAQRLFSPNKK